MTRQQKWQLDQQAKGLCMLCAQPRVTSNYCLKHAIVARERARLRTHSKGRKKSLTYRLQEAVQ